MGNSGVTSLLHRLVQPTKGGLVVPYWNTSFMDKSICTLSLHRRFPLWTGLSASFMECIPPGQVFWHAGPLGTGQPNYVSQSWMPHGVFWAESFLSVQQHTLEVSQWYSAVVQ